MLMPYEDYLKKIEKPLEEITTEDFYNVFCDIFSDFPKGESVVPPTTLESNKQLFVDTISDCIQFLADNNCYDEDYAVNIYPHFLMVGLCRNPAQYDFLKNYIYGSVPNAKFDD